MGDKISDLSGSADFHGHTGSVGPTTRSDERTRATRRRRRRSHQRSLGPLPTLHGGTCPVGPLTSCGSDEPPRAYSTIFGMCPFRMSDTQSYTLDNGLVYLFFFLPPLILLATSSTYKIPNPLFFRL